MCVACVLHLVVHVQIRSKLVHDLINEAYLPKPHHKFSGSRGAGILLDTGTPTHGNKSTSVVKQGFNKTCHICKLDAQRSYAYASIVNFDNESLQSLKQHNQADRSNVFFVESLQFSKIHNKTLFAGSALADAYNKMVLALLQEPRINLRFVIFENSRAGVGNKLRGLGAAVLIALKERRIVLLGEKMTWFADFYSDGLSNWLVSRVHVFNIHIHHAALKFTSKHEIPFQRWRRFVLERKNEKFWYCNWGSVPHDLHSLEIWDGCFGIPAVSGWERTHFLNPVSPCPKNTCFTQADGSVRNLYFITCWQIANLALVRANDRFLNQISKLKDLLEWETYDTRLGLQIRACVDCGRNHITNETFIINSIKCIEAQVLQVQAAHGKETKIAVYCATDKALWISKVALALEHTNVTVLSHGSRSKFIQTANGGSFDKLLSPMLDFHMLGETASIVVPHFTSFSNFAAARTRRMLYTGSPTGVGAELCKPIFSDIFVRNTPVYSNAHCASQTVKL